MQLNSSLKTLSIGYQWPLHINILSILVLDSKKKTGVKNLFKFLNQFFVVANNVIIIFLIYFSHTLFSNIFFVIVSFKIFDKNIEKNNCCFMYT